MTRRLALLLLVPLGLVLAGCGSSTLGAPESASTQGDEWSDLWQLFVVIAIIVTLLIWVLVVFAIIRYRRKSDDHIPTQKQYNLPLELGYTVVPLIVVGVLFGISLNTENSVTELADDPGVEVEVIGFQWQWQFNYLDEGISVTGVHEELPTLRLPVGETARFRLMSNDVIHSFWVPEFLTKRDLIPGIDNVIDVDVTREGSWLGHCAEYCGFDHEAMLFQVEAMPRSEYDAWIASVQAGEAENDPTIRLVDVEVTR